MGKIFKKIKRTVKKVTRPLGRIFKKVGGGIAKAGKYLYEGVAKVGGKIMSGYAKISDKLGPIGMIGMSIAMPYLLGAFSGAGGGLWTNFGTKMGGVVGKGGTVLQKGLMHSENPFLKVIGHAGKSIYNASNFVGGTTRGITQTITKTFGKGEDQTEEISESLLDFLGRQFIDGYGLPKGFKGLKAEAAGFANHIGSKFTYMAHKIQKNLKHLLQIIEYIVYE